MRKSRGYSLAELLTVIAIVVILAAVAIPLMRGRVDSAKWSEGKASAGTIATAIRAWVAGYNMPGSWTNAPGSLDAKELGFTEADLEGTYFNQSHFSWVVDYDGEYLRYVITVTKPNPGWKPDQMVLDTGVWEQRGI